MNFFELPLNRVNPALKEFYQNSIFSLIYLALMKLPAANRRVSIYNPAQFLSPLVLLRKTDRGDCRKTIRGGTCFAFPSSVAVALLLQRTGIPLMNHRVFCEKV